MTDAQSSSANYREQAKELAGFGWQLLQLVAVVAILGVNALLVVYMGLDVLAQEFGGEFIVYKAALEPIAKSLLAPFRAVVEVFL